MWSSVGLRGCAHTDQSWRTFLQQMWQRHPSRSWMSCALIVPSYGTPKRLHLRLKLALPRFLHVSPQYRWCGLRGLAMQSLPQATHRNGRVLSAGLRGPVFALFAHATEQNRPDLFRLTSNATPHVSHLDCDPSRGRPLALRRHSWQTISGLLDLLR